MSRIDNFFDKSLEKLFRKYVIMLMVCFIVSFGSCKLFWPRYMAGVTIIFIFVVIGSGIVYMVVVSLYYGGKILDCIGNNGRVEQATTLENARREVMQALTKEERQTLKNLPYKGYRARSMKEYIQVRLAERRPDNWIMAHADAIGDIAIGMLAARLLFGGHSNNIVRAASLKEICDYSGMRIDELRDLYDAVMSMEDSCDFISQDDFENVYYSEPAEAMMTTANSYSMESYDYDDGNTNSWQEDNDSADNNDGFSWSDDSIDSYNESYDDSFNNSYDGNDDNFSGSDDFDGDK